jgi:hypothetical protein
VSNGGRSPASGVETGLHEDGTANFIRGMPLYEISLALVHGNNPVLGVISLSVLRRR